MYSEEWGSYIWVAVKGQLKKGKGKGSKGKAKEKGKKRQRNSADERTRRRKGKGKHRGEDRHEPPSREDPLAEDLESVEVDEDDGGDESDDDDGDGGEEDAEEETMTYDPSIDVTPRPDVEVPEVPPRIPEIRRRNAHTTRPRRKPSEREPGRIRRWVFSRRWSEPQSCWITAERKEVWK